MTQRLAEIIKLTESLSENEQVLLIARLADRNRRHNGKDQGAPTWGSIRGLARPSLLGEEAQSWVSRSRAESDHIDTCVRNERR